MAYNGPLSGDAGQNRSGLPALVACLCAVAVLLILGAYLRAETALNALTRRMDALEANARALEADWAKAAGALEEAQRQLAVNAALLERRFEVFSAMAPSRISQGVAGAAGAAGAAGEAVEPASRMATPASASSVVMVADVPPAWSGQVVVMAPRRGGTIMVDKGRRDGLSPGDPLMVYRGGVYLGDVRVTGTLFETSAVCRPAGGGGFRIGDRVLLESP